MPVGEGGNQQQGVAIATQAFYEWPPSPHESAVPEHEELASVKTKDVCGTQLIAGAHFSKRMLGFAVTRSVLTPTCRS